MNEEVTFIIDSAKEAMEAAIAHLVKEFGNIRIEIFDGGKLDGDKVTIKYDNKTILRNYELQSEVKSIPISLLNKKNSFILIAENVGSMSTNTAVIEIFVDNSKIRALTNLKAGEQTQIDFYLK